MSNGPYKVQELSAAERDSVLKYLGKPLPKAHRKIELAEGFEVSGSFGITARDAKSGEVEWTHQQENLITDGGRFTFFDFGWTNVALGFSPSTEAPNVIRPGVATDGNQVVISGNLGNGTVTPSTYTKTWSSTFGTPTSNRTLGTLFVTYYTGTRTDVNMGVVWCWSYALLTPPKTQTTTQTIELVYKMAINPIY